MSITGALKAGGFKPEVSTAGDKPIFEGVYKAMFTEWKDEPEGKFGPQLMAAFKITETLAGRDSSSAFPEFRDYYKTDEEGATSKRNGIAKLVNGFFSVGKNIDQSSDEAFFESLNGLVGTAEVYIKGYKKQPMKQEGDEWTEDTSKSPRQAFTFMTEKNALKEADKAKKKQGHPL